MKSYSNNVVTKTDVDALDAKQTEQIKQLRIWLAVSFAINLLAAVGLHFI